VLYEGDRCLGGAVIEGVESSHALRAGPTGFTQANPVQIAAPRADDRLKSFSGRKLI
jgi:hypothetical protein